MAERERIGNVTATSLNVKGYSAQGVGVKKIARVALAAGTDTAGGIFAFANPEPGPILVNRVMLDVTTVATAACSVKVGSASNGTTAATNLIASQDVHSATGSFDSGAVIARVAAGAYVTGSTVSTGASAGLAGNAYIEYVVI